MVMSLTGDMRVFRPGCPDKAVYHDSYYGPHYGALFLGWGDDMRDGLCRTNNHYNDSGQYNIPVDKHGNCVLTGQGKGQPNDKKYFTCTALEVFLVE